MIQFLLPLSARPGSSRLPGQSFTRWLLAGPQRLLLGVLLLSSVALRPAAAQVAGRPQPPRYFRADAAATRAAAASRLTPRLKRYQAFTIDLAGIRTALAAAPRRDDTTAPPVVLSLPMPDGTTQRFALWEAPLLAPALAARYPELHTYGGQGLDDLSARISLTASPESFQVQILTDQPKGAAYLEAAAQGDALHYLSYYAHDVLLPGGGLGGCGAGTLPSVPRPTPPARRGGGPGSPQGRSSSFANPVGPTLSVYRLIVTTTKEYTNLRTNAAVMADVTALVNNVRTIQERDLAVTMTLVNTHFYQVGADGGYDQTNATQMIDQNRTNVETEFGAAAFDLGHLFATSGTGLAYTGVVGTTANGGTAFTYKAGAVSGNLNRTTPASYYSTSVITHEMGHQFSATHTFNTSESACGGSAYSGASAWEPGKGSTVMAYTDGGCDSPNNNTIQTRSDPYYHSGSVDQMRSYIESIPAIGTQVSSGNTAPVVTVPINRTIPQGTPFKLTATGTDANAADVLRYNWEELDLGGTANLNTAQATNTNVPLFRSVLPDPGGATRYFPSLSNLGGTPTASTYAGEQLPSVARTLSLRCTARDYHAVSGAVAANTTSGIVGGVTLSRLVALTVSAANATPFAVLAPSATGVSWAAGSTQSVSWNGVGTKSSAVNCQTVNVRLSTDGGLTYPTLLAAGSANVDDNTGTVSFTVPNVATSAARVMVEAADNYFFDISDNSFSITNNPAQPAITSLSPPSGPAGTTLTINGTGFGTDASQLSPTVGGVAATITGTVTNTSFALIVPATALTGNVVVTVASSGTASGGVFQVTPVVTSVSPTTGPVGATVTIAGNSFGGATRVSFNGTETTTFTLNTSLSPNTLTSTVPGGASTGAVVVYTAGGASNSDVIFTVVPFAVTSITPALNASAALESTPITVNFNAATSAGNTSAAPVKVTSLQAGGNRAGTTTTSANSVIFTPGTSFHAGEVVQLSVTPAATSSAGATLTQSYVSQFTVRTRARTVQNPAINPATGTQPNQVVTGDLNGDNLLDLVAVNTSAGTITVLLNNGTGTGFTEAPGSPVTVGANPTGAVLADLNNDGKLDLLVACSGGSGTISVLPGAGTGSFSSVTNITGAGPVQMIAVGDLNGDGLLDLVAPQLYTNVGRALIGLGTGSFSSGTSGFNFSIYGGLDLAPRAVTLADFNEDGLLDLASANFTGSAGTGSVSFRLGDGAGSFTGSTNLPASGAASLIATDLTSDGHVDLASSNPYASTAVFNVWPGTGTGSFSGSNVFTLTPSGGGFAYTLSTGDYDGDGIIDLVAPRSGFGANAGVDVFTYNSSTSAFTGPTIVNSLGFGNGPRYVAVADLNNDRTLDFVTANPSAATLSVSLTTPGGTALPVELLSFAAERRTPEAVALTWRTTSEVRNAGFEVERSGDGQVFQLLSPLIPSLGTSSAGRAYSYLDRPAPAGVLYYRLRQVNQGGQPEFSPVIAVDAAASAAAEPLLVYPNPARQTAFVQLNGPGPANAPVQVIDALGREVRHAPAPPAGTTLKIPLRGLPAGLYVVRCGVLSQRLVVE